MLARASDAATASAALPSNESLVDAASVALDDATASDSDGRRKRGASEMDGADEYDDDDDDDTGDYDAGKDELKGDGKRGSAASKQQQQQRSRRHNWQPKYEMEFGLLAIERDAVSNDVTLAMCGFCKAFGREGKYEQLLQQDADAGGGADTKKRRRRSLTTTKFFRAFRVDNIRSHLQGAHPRRWSEYEMLPKQESIRSRYLQMHGDFQYDGLPIDDVVLNAESDIAYAQAQAQAIHANLSDAQGPGNGTLTTTSSSSATGHHFSTAMAYSGARSHFDYEKHLLEQLAIDRERLEFEKAKFKKEVELRERELAMKEKMMEQQRIFHDKQVELAAQASDQESGKLARLGETIREALVGTDNSSANDSVV